MNSRIVSWLAVVADVIVTAVFWPRLPEQVPTHWNIRGEVDAMGGKGQLLIFGPVMLAGLVVLLEVLRRVDPKLKPLAPDAPPAEAGSREAVMAVVTWLLLVVHVSILLAATGAPLGGPTLMAVGFAGFQLFLGNLLPRVRPNFFVGIRTPWTISSDTVWRRTHRVAGKLLVAGGVGSLGFIVFAPALVAFPVTVGLLMVALLGPTAASYVYWRGEQRAATGGR
jgi:uncharacterized membrane protein